MKKNYIIISIIILSFNNILQRKLGGFEDFFLNKNLLNNRGDLNNSDVNDFKDGEIKNCEEVGIIEYVKFKDEQKNLRKIKFKGVCYIFLQNYISYEKNIKLKQTKFENKDTLDRFTSIIFKISECNGINKFFFTIKTKKSEKYYMLEEDLPFLNDKIIKFENKWYNNLYLYKYIVDSFNILKCIHNKNIFLNKKFDKNSFYYDKNSKIIFSHYNFLNYNENIFDKNNLIKIDYKNLVKYFYKIDKNHKIINKYLSNNNDIIEIW